MKKKYIYNNHTQKNFKKIIYCSLFYFIFNLVLPAPVYSKVKFCDPNVGWGPISKPGKNLLLEEFEDASKWNSWVFKNESLKLKNVKGLSGNALRIEYNIPDDSAFIFISKPIKNLDFNKDCTISFWIRAEGLPNELQIQILDADNGSFIRKYMAETRTAGWHKKEFHISELYHFQNGTNYKPDPPFRVAFVVHKGRCIKKGGKGWLELDDLKVNNINPHLQLSMNQVGFDPKSTKSAIIKLVNYNKNINSTLKYKIISLKDEKVKYKGKGKKYKKKMWGAQHWVTSFNAFSKPGKYKLQATLEINDKLLTVNSYPFEIKDNILFKSLSEPMFYYIKSTRYPNKTKHYDPVPGAYIDTEFDLEKWMTTIPTWHWGMSYFYYHWQHKKSFNNYDPADEINYTSTFCLKMQEPNTGGVYLGIRVKDLKENWPADVTAENDTHDLYLNKTILFDVTTSYIIGICEASKAFTQSKPVHSKKYLNSAILAWEYMSKQNITKSQDMGMYIWGSMILYNITKENKYLKMAKKYTKKLLPLQFLNYKLNNQKIFGKFFSDNLRNNMDYQHKFVHAMGMFIGLIDLVNVLKKNDPLRKKIMFHLDCFAYGYLKRTTELNPYGVVAQALEWDKNMEKMKLYFFTSPKSLHGDHGLNCDIMAMGIIALKYARLTKNSLFAKIAINQIDWVLGKNPFGFSMVNGIGETNPYLSTTDFSKGPVRGGIVNGIVSPKDGNTPKWVDGASSTEYWKPHNAMMLSLLTELESELLENPFKYPPKKYNMEKLYKQIDNYLSKTDYKIKKILFYGEKTPWTEQSSPDIQYDISIKNKAIKIDYQTDKAGAWTQISIDAQNKIHKNSIFYIKLKSTQDPNANLEIKIMAEDGSVFMKKILCKNLSKKWKNIKFRIKNFNYVWGGNNDIDKIKFLQIAIATLSKTSGSVSIKEIKKSNSN